MRRTATIVLVAGLGAAGCGGSGAAVDQPATSTTERPSPANVEPAEQEWPENLVASPDHEEDLEPPAKLPVSELGKRLPLALNDAELRIVGVSADGKRSIVEVSSPERSERELRRLYQDLLAAYGDNGKLLEPRFRTGDA